MSDLEDPWTIFEEKEEEVEEELSMKFPPQNKTARTMIQLLDSEGGIPIGWESFFQKTKSLLARFDTIVEKNCQETCHPRIWERFRAFHLLPTQRIKVTEDAHEVLHTVPLVKVVIIGQDPYTTVKGGVPTAMGMSFSVRNGHTLNPSLRNIFKRMKETGVITRTPMGGDLSPLANQGVFFLNMALTVPDKDQWLQNNPGKKYDTGKHVRPWRGFIEAVIDYLRETNPHCVYLLWGRKAQEIEPSLPSGSERFSCSHPMPLSYKREKDGFNTMDHFNQANTVLAEYGIKPIDWDVIR